MDYPAYRQALADAAKQLAQPITHRGLDAGPCGDAAIHTLNRDGVSLKLWLSPADGAIQGARFEAADDEAILEVFCRTIESLPFEEAAAYGADYTLHRLNEALGRPAGVGILRAAAVLPVLGTAQAILRGLRSQTRTEPGMAVIHRARFLDVPADWRGLTAEERLERIRDTIACHLRDIGAPGDLLWADRLEDDIRKRPVRVILTHAKDADATLLPGIMRAIEQRLRREVAPWLELYAEERVDRNALRRTILIEQRPS